MTDNVEQQELEAMVEKARVALKEAEEYAKEKGLSFYYSGPAYGMGGWFHPGWSDDGWEASSGSC